VAAASLWAVAEEAPAIGIGVLGPDQPGVFERIEFRLPAVGNWANPYDSTDVEAAIAVTLPSGRTMVVPAFFMVPFEPVPLGEGSPGPEWLHPGNSGEFRTRFAPPEPGRYSVRATLDDRIGRRESGPVSFEAVPSARRGYLGVSRRDPRFFGFADGTPFFPIGNNVAFVGPTQYMTLARAAEAFRRMGEDGANYARVWVCCED
jgi:hypothetical protein